jgi:hypothetical protein
MIDRAPSTCSSTVLPALDRLDSFFSTMVKYTYFVGREGLHRQIQLAISKRLRRSKLASNIERYDFGLRGCEAMTVVMCVAPSLPVWLRFMYHTASLYTSPNPMA